MATSPRRARSSGPAILRRGDARRFGHVDPADTSRRQPDPGYSILCSTVKFLVIWLPDRDDGGPRDGSVAAKADRRSKRP